jgi:hypothetical protein
MLPPTWDNLVHVNSKKLQAVYLLTGADFRQYARVQLDPTELKALSPISADGQPSK